MREQLRRVREYVFTAASEDDPGFWRDIERGSIQGLRTVGALEVAVPLAMLVAGIGAVPVPITDVRHAAPNLLLALLGVMTLAAGWLTSPRRSRSITAVSMWLSTVIVAGSALYLVPRMLWVEHHILGYILFVMFGAAAALPFRPVHTLALGCAVTASHLVLTEVARSPFDGGFGWLQHVFILATTGMCTALTASVYRQRRAGYLAHQEALRTSERLRETESQLLISENAAVMGRVAAGLSHELNSPIGVLSSAVQSLATIAARMGSAAPGEQERLRKVAEDLAQSGRISSERLHGIVARMQRFTNLDRADVQSANLRDLVADVVAMVDSGAERQIETDLEDVPRILCRPQQLSAVFSNLVTNAVDAGGRVRVTTRQRDGYMEVRIEDSGRGMTSAEAARLFDPGAFHEANGRVAAGNWSLFSCRQIVREHGGDIDVESEEGRGTTVVVRLRTHA